MKTARFVACPLVAILVFGSAAQAAVSVFSTPANTQVGGQPVSAQATFTTGAGTVHIVVQNLITDPRSVIQNLSALGFILGGGQSAGTLVTSSANLRSVASNNFTDSGSAATGWKLESAYNLASVLGLRLCDLCAGADGPAHTLIGGPAGSGGYPNANGSINGNGPHNPFLSGNAVFDLNVTGVTAQTTISKVRFQFGTADGTNFVDVTTLLAVEDRTWDMVKELYR